MPIATSCPQCRVKLRVKDELDGKKVRCQKCNGVFVVAADLEDSPAAAPKADSERSRPSASEASGVSAKKPPPAPAKEELAAKLVDDDEDDRPRRRRRRDEDDEDDDRDDRDDRRSRSRRRDDDDDDDDRPRRRKNRKKDSGGSSAALIGSIAGGVALVVGIVAFIIVRIVISRGVQMAMNNPPPRPNIPFQRPNGPLPGVMPPGAVRKPNLAGPKIAPIAGAKTLTLQNGAVTEAGNLGFFDKSPRGDGRRCKAYKVELEANTTYTIEMKSGVIDAYLYLMNPDGVEIAVDDDSGGGADGLDSLITIEVDRAGVYEIHASSFTNNERGAYTLTIRKGQ